MCRCCSCHCTPRRSAARSSALHGRSRAVMGIFCCASSQPGCAASALRAGAVVASAGARKKREKPPARAPRGARGTPARGARGGLAGRPPASAPPCRARSELPATTRRARTPARALLSRAWYRWLAASAAASSAREAPPATSAPAAAPLGPTEPMRAHSAPPPMARPLPGTAHAGSVTSGACCAGAPDGCVAARRRCAEGMKSEGAGLAAGRRAAAAAGAGMPSSSSSSSSSSSLSAGAGCGRAARREAPRCGGPGAAAGAAAAHALTCAPSHASSSSDSSPSSSSSSDGGAGQAA